MPRNDDRCGNTRLYIGHLSSRTRTRDLEKVFGKYGRFVWFYQNLEVYGQGAIGENTRRVIRAVDMKQDYAFVEFSDPRDADDARYSLDNRDVDGSRIIVEFAKGVPRGSRESGRFPPPGSGRCFNCGIEGHWARDCKAGDWKNKCYRCGERGHVERNCKNSPQKLSHGRSHSRSPVRSHRRRSRDRSHSRGRSYSRSRSPAMRRRGVDRDERLRSPCDPSPERNSSPPPRNRRSPSLSERSPRERRSASPRNGREGSQQDGSGYSDGPKGESPGDHGGDGHENKSYVPQTNGRDQSASPRDDKSPRDDEDDSRLSPRGSESS